MRPPNQPEINTTKVRVKAKMYRVLCEEKKLALRVNMKNPRRKKDKSASNKNNLTIRGKSSVRNLRFLFMFMIMIMSCSELSRKLVVGHGESEEGLDFVRGEGIQFGVW